MSKVSLSTRHEHTIVKKYGNFVLQARLAPMPHDYVGESMWSLSKVSPTSGYKQNLGLVTESALQIFIEIIQTEDGRIDDLVKCGRRSEDNGNITMNSFVIRICEMLRLNRGAQGDE